MSCEGRVYVGQIGVMIEVETQREGCPVVDWSDATTLEILCRLPDRTQKTFTATLVGTTLRYITDSANDLPQRGAYAVQAHVVGPGYDALGETDSFRVYDKWQ